MPSITQQYQLKDLLFQQPQIQLFNTNQIQNRILNNHKIKQIIIITLSISFILYKLIYSSTLKSGQCIKDITHSFTQFINSKLNQDGDFAYYFMIIGQFFIDIQMMMFIIFQMFKMDNFFLSSFIGVFYGIRGAFLNIVKFPYPQHVFWDQPGFPPSIGVPYGVTSDYFYSGHTGIMLFSYLFWSQKQQTALLKYISLIGLPYIILLVLASRVHYIVDVFAAIFFCLWIYRFVKNNLIYFDKFLNKGYTGSIYILGYIDIWLMFVLRLKRNKTKIIEINNNIAV